MRAAIQDGLDIYGADDLPVVMTAYSQVLKNPSNRELADSICKYVEVAPGRAEVTKFSDGESYVETGQY